MNSSAEQIGYAVGLLVGIAFTLGILAFCILAIVKAFTKKTTGWIIAGSIGGLMVLFLTFSIAAGVMRGFATAMRKKSGSYQATTTASPQQTIQGRTIAYTIQIPDDWIIQRQKQDFDILAHYESLYLGVIAEEANVGGLEVISQLAHKNLEKVAEEVQWEDPTQVVVDGRNWLKFSVTCKVEKLPFYYQYHVYSGPEGTFQIITWTYRNLATKSAAQMEEVAESFVFPK